MISPRKHLLPLVNTSLDLPAPMNLSYMWNFGSALGAMLSLQIMTGLLMTMHYSPNMETAFLSVAHISRDVTWGWLLRNLHANGASMFFILMYLHMLRASVYMSFKKHKPWMIGVTIYLLTMATAFMGYLLPWGQMSFWGATVITNLFSALPYIGPSIVLWIWGGFAVSGPTLTRFFALHFILPFVVAAFSALHLIFLHEVGSSGPLGQQNNLMKTPFHIHYTTKDLLGILIMLFLLFYVSSFSPNLFTDPENFIPANPMITPTHIKPEWYFLWAYAILRSIPNKLGGVTALFSAIFILYLFPLVKTPQKSAHMSSIKYFTFSFSITIFILLTWIGGNPVEEPFISIGMVLTIIYFILPLFMIPRLVWYGFKHN